jgi:monothiol glutaredoxin
MAYEPVTTAVAESRKSLHADLVAQVLQLVASEKVLVVGMAWNQPVRKARQKLDEMKVTYRYFEHGNYIVGWKARLALKIFFAWPTFPMIFVNGTFIGGNRDLRKAVEDGTFQALLDGPRSA